ncbi:hypothetical protein ACC705_35180, partial [Rhizobium ruizarguesonis]
PQSALNLSVGPLGQPRIIILPPESIFTDPLMERVGRALLEDVTIGLIQQRGFKVIAAHTSLEILRCRCPRQPAGRKDILVA